MISAPVPPHPLAAAPAETALLARLFQALSDPTRLRIMQLLLEGEQNVSALVAALVMPQGRVSSHLMCLRWCGFVTTRRAGKYVYYRISDPRVSQLVHLAQALLADHQQHIATCAVINRER